MKIALTFDDGPHPEYTPQILDILDEYGIKATFFIIGENANRYPEIVKREIEGGNEIGNHTYNHKFMNKLNREQIGRQLSESERVVDSICDYCIHFVRPPGGIYTDQFERTAGEMSYGIALWSVDTRDWKRPSVDYIVNVVLNTVRSGDIILMHDYVSGNSSTPEALKIIIPALLEDGFEFVTVSELASFAGFEE